MPKELSIVARQLEKIRAAKQVVEEDAKRRSEAAKREREAQNDKPKYDAQKKRGRRAKSRTPDGRGWPRDLDASAAAGLRTPSRLD